MSKKFKVAIVCHTFNHEPYISAAIESFLLQKKDLNIQIIIHDDASTDNTKEIILSYASKYPGIIFPIFQNINQFSRGSEGKKNVFDRILKLIDSEYVATCEGDDYWTIESKLLIQVTFLDSNSKYGSCCHAAKLKDESISKFIGNVRPYRKNQKVDFLDLLLGGGGGFIPSSSWVVRCDIFKKYPTFGCKLPIGDYQAQLLYAYLGDVYYMDSFFSIYRMFSIGSWSSRNRFPNPVNRIEFFNNVIEMLMEFDCFTDHEFSQEINLAKIYYGTIIGDIYNKSFSNKSTLKLNEILLNGMTKGPLFLSQDTTKLTKLTNHIRRLINFFYTIISVSRSKIRNKFGVS